MNTEAKWTPLGTHGVLETTGNGRCPHPRSYRHPQCMSGSDRARSVHVDGLADSYAKYRIPGPLFAEMLTDFGILREGSWTRTPTESIGGM